MPQNCPQCLQQLERIRRRPWMRRIPGSKHYMCRTCSTSYLLILDRWLIKRHLHHLKTGSL